MMAGLSVLLVLSRIMDNITIMLDYDTLQQPSPLIEVESTTTSDTVEYSTSSTTWQELIKAEE